MSARAKVTKTLAFTFSTLGILAIGMTPASADIASKSGVLSCPTGQQVRIWSNTPAANTDSVSHYWSTESGHHGTDTWELSGIYPVSHHTFTLQNDTVYWRVAVTGDVPRFSAGASCYP